MRLVSGCLAPALLFLLTACGAHLRVARPSTSAVGVPAAATTFSNIQNVANWSSCTICAGPGGNGPSAIYAMTEGVASPSLSGMAAQFSITGGSPWSAALWWKQLGGNDAATHFIYDVFFYMDDVGASQALEFNVNQNAAGRRYIFGTQCDLRGSHTWRVWDTAQHWVTSGIACSAPAPNAWHHLVWEFERTAGGEVMFNAVTLDGVRTAVNMRFASYPSSGSGVDVAFQMDADGVPTPYSVWLDRVSLTYW